MKTILSKRDRGVFKNHRKREQKKNRNEHHNDRNIGFPSINENCRGTWGKDMGREQQGP